MNILHVNNVDLLGNRFNGHDMQITLNSRGIRADQVVMEHMGNDPHTVPLAAYPDEPFLQRRIMECEKELGFHCMIYPYLFRLMETPEFQKADVVHYHLLQNYFGALPIFPEITKKKPSVLTIHDPWIFTGHCIHPMECEKWKDGCGNCSNLGVNFPMKVDRTAFQWEMKKKAFAEAKVELIVASEFMKNFVERSPITKHIKQVHLIPFGIDIDRFSVRRDQKSIRKRLHIPEENFVLCFRADPSAFKGFETIKQMLLCLKPSKPVTVIAVGNAGMLDEVQGKYQVLDLDWITDDDYMADLYCACDMFLMPSTAEAFGLMAIEAMASGRPVLVCEGTSLPSVTFAPECGIVIAQRDVKAMTEAVERLIRHPEECAARGRLGRELAEKHYNYEDYIDRHLKLYEQVVSRF